MTPQEVSWRLRDEMVKRRWRTLKGAGAPPPASGAATFAFAPLEPSELALDPAEAQALIAAAERILAGRLPLFERDMPLPQSARDWFTDPDSGGSRPTRLIPSISTHASPRQSAI